MLCAMSQDIWAENSDHCDGIYALLATGDQVVAHIFINGLTNLDGRSFSALVPADVNH